MSDLVPEGWSYDQLGDYISESVAGEWGIEATGDANDIPVLRSTNFTASGIIDYSKLAYRNIDERKRLAKSLKFGDIVLEKSGGSPTQPVGRVVYFDKYKPFLFSNFTQKLSPVDTCDSKFLFYKLYSEYQNGTVLKFQQQTTGIINFQLAEYLGYKSAFPPLPEQQKIATILSSVDDVIEKTRAQIDKLKDLKTGMMQELLTKGIGHTEFKDSPVGQIPRSWDVVSVGSLTDVIDPQPDHRTPAEVIDGVPYVGLGDIGKSGLIDFSAARKVSQEAFEKQKEGFEIHPGAFIFGKIGTIGKPYVLPTERFYCLSANVVLVTTKKSINMKYLFQVFGSEIIDQQVLLQTNTTSQPALGIKKVRDFLVPYPKQCEEVELITEVLASVDNRISRVNDKLAHQLDLKKALMQDLLTGKVRVNLTDKESAVV